LRIICIHSSYLSSDIPWSALACLRFKGGSKLCLPQAAALQGLLDNASFL
jgi:hypothetical protein